MVMKHKGDGWLDKEYYMYYDLTLEELRYGLEKGKAKATEIDKFEKAFNT